MLGAVLAKAARLGPAADRAPDAPNQSAGRLPRTSDEGIQCSSPNASGLGSDRSLVFQEERKAGDHVFLLNDPVDEVPSPFTIVLNWTGLLKR